MTGHVKREGKVQQDEHPETVKNPPPEQGGLCQELPGLNYSRKPHSPGVDVGYRLRSGFGQVCHKPEKNVCHTDIKLGLIGQALPRALC